MRRKIHFGILLLLAVVLSSATAFGQGLENYRFETGTDGVLYADDVTFDEIIASGQDDAVSAVTNIGFTFVYDGSEYTHFSVNSNGRMRLGDTQISTAYNNPFSSSTYSANTPAIVAVGRDCSTGAAGYVKTGLYTSGSMNVRVIECLLNTASSTTGTNYIKFQIQLYKGTNEVRIVYDGDNMTAPSAYQIGIGNADASKFWYVNPGDHTATYSTTYTSSTYGVHPGANRYYSFVERTTAPYFCDFESATENEKWTFANGDYTNRWIVGNGTYASGSTSLYVSNDGSSYAYSASSQSYVYAYRSFYFASAGDYVVSFKWKARGEGGCWDAMYAALVPSGTGCPPANDIGGSLNALPTNYINVADVSQSSITSGVFLWTNADSDWRISTKTITVSGAGEYTLVFYWKNDGSGGTNPPAAVDDIEIASPCDGAATLSANVLDATSVEITRTSENDINYQLLVSTSSDMADATETPVVMTSETMTIGGLLPGTQYYAYIRSYCSEYRFGEWGDAVGFVTEDRFFNLPYSEGFENETANDWIMANATNGWYVGTATAKDGDYSMYISNDNGVSNEYDGNTYSYSYAYCKLLVEETGVFNVSFDWKCDGYFDYHMLRAFVVPVSLNPNLNSGQSNGMSNAYNDTPAGWIAVGGDVLNDSEDWVHVSDNLVLTETGQYYLVFYWRNDYYSLVYNPPAAVDNISVEFSTSCLPVTDLITTNVGKTSASVAWTPIGGETQWQVSLTTTPNASPDDGNITLVNTTSHTFSGLNYYTYYYAYARAYCSESDQSPWSSAREFLTLESCSSISDLTISGVTSNAVTLSWTNTDADASQWEVKIYNDADNLITLVDNTTPTITGLTPNAWYYVEVRCDCGEFGYSDYSSRTEFLTSPEPVTLPYSEDFESGMSSHWAVYNDDNGWYTGRATNNGGTRSLYISDSDGASNSYNIESNSKSYALFAFGIEERSILNASYDWKSDGEDSYDYARAFIVPASLDPLFASGEDNGIGYNGAPNDWIAIDDGQMTNSSSWSRTSKNVVLDAGNYYLAFYWTNDGSVGTQPPVAIDNLSVAASACMYDGDVSVSDVGKTTATASWNDYDGISQWEVLVSTSSNPTDAIETPVSVDNTTYNISGIVPGTQYYVYVRGVCSESSKSVWYQDDFTTLPACLPVENVSVGSYDKTSVTLSWTNTDDDASQWQVLVTTASNPDEATESPVLVDNASPTITGLTPDTYYYVYVRAYCSETAQSTWSTSSNFTTNPACMSVANFRVDSYDDTWVTLSWTNRDDDATQWQVQFTKQSYENPDYPYDGRLPQLVDNTNPTIYGLTPNTIYYAWVRSYCSESSQSAWSSKRQFSTYPTCRYVQDVTINSYDSTSVSVSWTNVDEDASQWEVHIKPMDQSGATDVYEVVYNCSATINGLQPYTEYRVFVRAICSETEYGGWNGSASGSFTTYPPCVPPAHITAVVNSNAANLTWRHDYDLSTFHMYLSDTEMSESELNALTSSEYETVTGKLSHNYTGLAEGQTYHFYIRSICQDDELSYWAHAQFTTTTDEVMTLPYYQDFETDVLENWHLNNGENGWYFGTAIANEGDKSLYISYDIKSGEQCTATNSTSYSYAYCRLLVDQPCVVNVSFDWIGSAPGQSRRNALRAFMIPASLNPELNGGGSDGFSNGMSNYNSTAPNGWIDVSQNGVMNDASSWQSSSKDVSLFEAGEYYFVFFCKTRATFHPYNQAAAVDNLSIEVVSTCVPVKNLSIGTVGKTSATVSWQSLDIFSQWQVLVTTASTPEEATETPILVDATTATVTNLEMDTHYHVFVRTYCSESSQSAWSSSATFTTLPPCEPVYDVNAVVTQTSAKIRWQHPYGRTNYFTIFSETAMTQEELAAASHQTTSDKYWNLNDLTPGTTYHEYIAADCGDGDVSEWVDLVFTTPEQDAMPLPYYEDFEDGYMQNWIVSNQVNGWSLGSAVASAVPSESTMSMYISPDDGVTYQYSIYYSVSYAYCRLYIDHPCLINVSYDWTGEGFGVAANMRTFLIPTSLNPNLTAGRLNGVTSIANTVNTPEGWIELGTPYPVQCSFFNRGAANAWLRSSKDVTIAEAGDYYLVYFWGNNEDLPDVVKSAAVDNISVTHVSDCIFAGNISVDEVRREDASVSWTYLDGSQWEVLVSRSNNAASATETPVLVSSPSYTAQNLSASTTYYVYVRTYCSESEQSPWSSSVSFTTLPPCETVSIVSAQINRENVYVTWSQPYSYNQFYVYLSQTEMSDAELNASPYEIVDNTDFYADGLTPGVGYHMYISSVCSSFDNSEWYDYYFETPSEYFTIPYHEDFDSNIIYGWDVKSDGSNGWIIGSSTSTNGSQSLYVAEDGSYTNEYNNYACPSFAYAYCPIYIDRAGLISVSFDWRANGETRYDFMRAFLAPSNITLWGDIGIEYNASDNNSLPDGCISIEGGTSFYGVDEWQHASNSVRVEPGLYNLVYFWHNDYSDGDNPPGAVDDITIVWLSEETDILSFDFDGAENVQIDNESHTVTCNVAHSVNLRAVRPVITVSDGATISPASGASVNLNNSFVYTVTAEAGNTQAWTVHVSKDEALAEAEILSFWTEGLVEVSIDSDNATVNATISRMYDITSLVPTIEISTYASINQVVGRAYDFSNPVEFVVTAEDGTTTKYWTINVSYYDTPLGVDCSNPYVVDAESELPYVHTSSTEDMLNMLNTYFSDSPLNQMVLSGNDVVYRIDVDARKMIVVSAQSYGGNFSVFVMNTCGSLHSYMVDSKINDSNASFTVDCRSGSYYVIIDSNNDDVSYEIQIQELPHCYIVEDLEVSRLQNELGVTWSSDNIGDTWTVKYGLSGFDLETEGSTVNVSAPHYEITGLTESTLYDIYVRANCAGSNGNSEWTLISASTIAACQAPEDLAAVEIFDNEATVSWNGFNMTQWEFGYKMESDAEYTTMVVNENSVNLTDLQYSTSYNVRVRSVCDGDYSGYAEYTFTTMCLVVRSFPYTEDFGSGTFPPLCWTQERTAAGSGMGVSYANGAWTSASAAVGGNSTTKAMLADTKAGSVHNLVTTGMIFAENLNGYSISLDVYRSSVSVSSFDEGVEVWVNSSPDIVNGSPQMLGYVSKNYQHSSATVSEEAAPGWYTYNFIARNRTGLNYVILVGKSNNAGGVYIDNLVIDKTVDCLSPNNLVLQSSGDDNAVLAWSDINAITGTWTVRYSIDGGDEVEATVDEPSITINGLLPNTIYQISAQIQSVCAAGMESDLYEASIEVTTGCAILDAPYSENFDSYDGVTPDCWFAASDGNNVWAVSNGMAHIASASTMNNAHLMSPRFNLSGDNRYLMSFDVLQSTLNVSRPDSLFVLFIKDGTEIDTLRSVAIQNASSNGMVQIKVDVPQTNGVGSFDFALNGYRECKIDNFLLRAKSNEAEILTFAIEEQTTAPVIDPENATISVYVVAELENGMEFAPTFTISENATVDVPSGEWRDFSEPVEYVVTAEDGVTIKTWTVTVRVDENYCQNPTANDINLAVAADSVTITIAQVNNETSYDLMVSTVQITPETDTADVFSGNVGAVTVINGLQYNTNYYVYVRSDCGTTRWTALTFATSCDVKQLPFSEDFSASSMPECWSIVDANDDNKTWALSSGEMVYTYSRLREADDYIVSPEISIVHNAKLKFDYHVGNFSYPETFSVYVLAGNDSIRLDSMTVSNESVQTFGPVDLTDFAGQDVRIAIRCQSARYMYRLYVDNFDISVSNYVLEASAVGRGTITPSGLLEVAPGGSAEFVMSADEYNEFVSLTIDGEDVTDDVVDGAYTLAEVYDEHSIVATFTERYHVVASSGVGGHLEPEGEFVVDAGDSKRFFIVPDEGYRFASLTVDGDAVALESGNLIYSLDSITADHNVYVNFTPIIYYTISVTSSENGIVNPNGNISAEEGTSLTLYVLPDEGFMIGDFLVDGVDVSADIVNGEYTFENIAANHNVNVIFVENVYYTVTATSGEHGTITPEGETQVVNGGSISFEVVPDEGYYVASFTVDGNDAMSGLVNGVYVLDDVTADHEVYVGFEIYTYNIFAYAVGGTISPSGTTTVAYGQSQTYELTPNYEYELSNVFIDNHVVEVDGNTYTFENVTASHNIVAVFTPMNITRYTISASAGEHGSISPSGNVRVVEGDDQTFEIVPDEHYYISSLLVDGESVDVDESYTFVNVAANHTIVASFEVYKHIVTATAGENGAVSPAGETVVDEGANVELQFLPDEGYWVSEVVVDGDTIATHSNEYVVENVLDDIEVVVNFEPLPQWTITAMASEYGSISPEGVQYVTHGSSIEFVFLPDDGYMVERVVVDGATVAINGNSYTFENVTGDHYIYVSFRTLAYFITTVVGEHGRITPSGVVEVQPGESKMFRFVPDVGYMVDSVRVDGMNVMFSNNVYTFNNVTENHVLEVTFRHINVAVDVASDMRVSLYPNPNDGHFSVDFAGISGDVVFQLVDAGGALVDVRDIYVDDGSTMEFSYNLVPGVYFARFVSDDKVVVERFVVK